MIELQKQQIHKFRADGASYATISSDMGLSINTIKSFCRRNNLVPPQKTVVIADKCKHCKKPLKQAPKLKPKTFCNDKCRYAWWSGNRNNPAHKATCACCGETFNTRGNSARKFCSHACYVVSRFGEGERHDQSAV